MVSYHLLIILTSYHGVFLWCCQHLENFLDLSSPRRNFFPLDLLLKIHFKPTVPNTFISFKKQMWTSASAVLGCPSLIFLDFVWKLVCNKSCKQGGKSWIKKHLVISNVNPEDFSKAFHIKSLVTRNKWSRKKIGIFFFPNLGPLFLDLRHVQISHSSKFYYSGLKFFYGILFKTFQDMIINNK